MSTVIDRVALTQPGDSTGRIGAKWILLLLLVPTFIGQLLGLYFLAMGVVGWLDARHEPDYVPFRPLWAVLAGLTVSLSALYGWIAYNGEPDTAIGIWGAVVGLAIGLVLWLALLGVRFAWHLIKLRPR